MSKTSLGVSPSEYSRRDAVHVAVLPIQAGATIARGGPVYIETDGKAYPVVDPAATPPVGIADPFHSKHVFIRGERFWILMTPNTVANLRHDWDHPALPAEKTYTKAEIDAAVAKAEEDARAARESEDAYYYDDCQGC